MLRNELRSWKRRNTSDPRGAWNRRSEEVEGKIQERKRTGEIHGRLLMRNGVQRKTLSIIRGDAPLRWLPDQGIPLPSSNIAKT
jgi:hypothetical protein